MTLIACKKPVLRALFIVLLVSAGCAAPRVQPPATAPEPPRTPVQVQVEQEQEAAEKEPAAKVQEPAPAPASTPAPEAPARIAEQPAKAEEQPAPAPVTPSTVASAPRPERSARAPEKRHEEQEHEHEIAPIPQGHSYSTLAERNDERLLHVFVGMYRITVEKIMGARYFYKREFWKDINDQIYEVLFYLTREPRKGKPVTERHLTPVLIKNDRVSAIGKYQLKKLRRAARRTYAPATAQQ